MARLCLVCRTAWSETRDREYNLLYCLHIAEDRTICRSRRGSIYALVAMQHDPLAGFVAELKPKHTEKTVTILIKIVRGHAYHDVNDGVMCTIDHDRPMYGYDDPR